METVRRSLTDRQREIVSVVIQLSDERRAAEALSIAYGTLRRQLEDIKQRLNLEDRFIPFSALAIEDPFIHNGVKYRKVPHAQDRFGGYNAQDEAGKRYLFQRMDIVEVI